MESKLYFQSQYPNFFGEWNCKKCATSGVGESAEVGVGRHLIFFQKQFYY